MNNPMMNDSLLAFASVYHEPMDLTSQNLICMQFSSSSPAINQLLCFPCEVCIELISGLASIAICPHVDSGEIYHFPIHSYLRLKPSVLFNILPISNETIYYLIAAQSSFIQHELPTSHMPPPSSIYFNILKVVDYYFANENLQYRFHKASHDYYELLYVNSGRLTVEIANHIDILENGDLILYPPNCEHAKRLTKNTTCSYLSVAFDMHPPENHQLLEHIFHCGKRLRETLQKIIEESDSHSSHSSTLIVCYLQETITHLLQIYDLPKDELVPLGKNANQNFQKELLKQVLSYMNERVAEPITIEEICHHFFLSRSSLQSIFKAHLHNSPKSYLLDIKLQKSKELIRENHHTISEIADLLGFSSIHYFSRLFKKYFGISPSEYAKISAHNHNN